MIALAFLWHQHQPYYPDDVAGENAMPWVRLHGVKSYYGMALHLLEFPEMRCTINLVPSLLLQLRAYAEHGATDRFLQAARVPADGLSEADALFLLDHFFLANAEHMIRPYPRYWELYQRRAAARSTAKDVLRRFSERDLRDLQVWFNLTWVHPLAFERDPELKALRGRGRNFTEEDKRRLLDKHLEILRQVIPLHQELAQRGQVELTTTPFYHPILPLLLDKKLAREALPDVKLPHYALGYPDDAAVHVRRAVAYHAEVFGAPPRGLWPAEGSVCQPMLPLLAEHGIRWIATDEEVLSASTQGFISRDGRGHVLNPDRMYRPYRVAEAGHELGIVFRDHALSDRIGFQYQRGNAVESADDFVGRLRAIGRAAAGNGGPPLVSIILDGENCWEHYPGGGVDFLRALYERCSRAPDIRPVQVGEFLQKHPPRDTLPHLFAGSWINHNFAIWVGHEEDNTAWDALHRAREHLKQQAAEPEALARGKAPLADASGSVALEPEALARGKAPLADASGSVALGRAWEELYIAEGSDWFWWYGDDHSSAQDALFDYLFRKHLQNVYLLLGDAPPADLARPIMRRGQRATYTLPRAFLDVTVNGRRTFFEWLSAGRYIAQHERGTMAMATRGPIKEVYFGFNVRFLFARVDFDRAARKALADVDVLRLGFVEPAGWEVLVLRPGRADQAVELRKGGEVRLGDVAVGIDQIAELAVPFEALELKASQPLQFFVELHEGRQSRDRAPREGTINLLVPAADFEQFMWDA